MIGLCGCQIATTDSAPSDADWSPSFPVTSSETRPLKPPFTIGILPFENLNRSQQLTWLGRALAEMLTHDLAAWPFLSIVSRDALGDVLREQWIQQRGFSSPLAPIALGHIQGVRYLIRGGFYQQKNHLTIHLQILDVQTGVVVRTMSAQGSKEDLPRLEQNLVENLLQVFDSSFDLASAADSDDVKDEPYKLRESRVKEREQSLHPKELESFGTHSVHGLDLQLSLERITQQRLQVYQAAIAFWRDGWSMEMGQPTYDIGQATSYSASPTSLLRLPIALFMKTEALADVLGMVKGWGVDSFIRFEPYGMVRDSRDTAGISQLFLEQVRQPRRMYVRALNEHGELLAVFSKWDWQTGTILQNSGPDEIRLPLWPQACVSGVAEFPVSWVERDGAHVTFDVVFEPISEEKRILVLEPVLTGEDKNEASRLPADEERDVLDPLQDWIQLKWSPPITETLPVDGYLPSNREAIQAILHVQGGNIVRVDYLNSSSNPLISRSLEELKSDLVGYCVSCSDEKNSSTNLVFDAIRLQLILVKDLHALRIGSRSPSPRGSSST